MKEITSFFQAKELWAIGKESGRPALTNFFLSQRSIERAVSKEQLFGIGRPGASLIFRRDRDFFHLYANFSNADLAAILLSETLINLPIVADVIQRGQTHQELVDLLAQGGFSGYRNLTRLIRRPQYLLTPRSVVNSQHAIRSDADLILSSLESHFDRFSEQLPEIEEIEEAISNNQIIVSSISDRMAGFLFFESSGKSSILRYWFVDPEFRNLNIGSTLIRHYLTIACPDSSSGLWVLDDNYNAIEKYRHYGYESDSLTDSIMMRK